MMYTSGYTAVPGHGPQHTLRQRVSQQANRNSRGTLPMINNRHIMTGPKGHDPTTSQT